MSTQPNTRRSKIAVALLLVIGVSHFYVGFLLLQMQKNTDQQIKRIGDSIAMSDQDHWDRAIVNQTPAIAWQKSLSVTHALSRTLFQAFLILSSLFMLITFCLLYFQRKKVCSEFPQ